MNFMEFVFGAKLLILCNSQDNSAGNQPWPVMLISCD